MVASSIVAWFCSVENDALLFHKSAGHHESAFYPDLWFGEGSNVSLNRLTVVYLHIFLVSCIYILNIVNGLSIDWL